MFDYWISLHSHTHYSNNSYFEVVTKPEDYVQYAKEKKLPAVCITDHGGVYSWIKKKELIEAAGLKYIHGMEAYVCQNAEDKSRYHTILIAKNYEGVKEINRLSSQAFNRQDGHYYYKPRIFFDELKQAVENNNIIVTTACLAGALSQTYKSVKEANVCKQWIKFASDHKDNVFLEIQPHIDKDQKDYNEFLAQVASAHGLKLIAANDIHALNPEHDRLRKIIKKGKRNGYENDDQFELWYKTRSEMIESFKKQGVLSDKLINEALDATVKIVEQVEEFELDKSHKYPRLYDNPEHEFQKRIKQGIKNRGINKLPAEEQKKYIKRINSEYKVYKNNGAIDYMLSHEDILNAAKDHGVKFGYGRGSVSGSLIAYLCGQTEMDSVKLGLNFERFMNPERISLADIDVDSWKPDQQWIQKWILTNPKWHAASIMTANTYGLKAAIKAIADGLDRYAGKPAYIQSIRNQIGDDNFIPEELYEDHRELIDYAKKVIGVIDSFGRHAAGIVIDTNTIDDTMGTQTIAGWDYPVTQIAMKEIDHYNWVKYDMLGLDNVGLITRAAELAGLSYPTPDSEFIDFEDEKVWNSMRSDNIGVFQMEGDRAGKLLRDMLSPDTIANIRSTEEGKQVKYMDLLSLVNAAQRPSGSSYVDSVTHGHFKDNGHPALNEFLAPTLGELVYQEQLIQFLVQFCDRTPGEADVLRRAVGKKQKDVIEEEVPKIHRDFVKTMITKYHDTPEHAEKIANDFMRVFMDAANYGFSINHSMAYSYIGYISTWLRYYYPLEWCTAAFEIWQDKQEKVTRVAKFAEEHGIKLKPVKYRKSKGSYFMDKETNSIYEGTATIKGVNEENGDFLFLIGQKEQKNFINLLLDIFDNSLIKYPDRELTMSEFYGNSTEEEVKSVDLSLANENGKITFQKNSPVAINSRVMIALLRLDYFAEFGNPKKLEQIYERFKKAYKAKNKKLLGKYKRIKELINYEESLNDTDYSLTEKLGFEHSLLGRCFSVKNTVPSNYAFVEEVIKRSKRSILTLYSIRKGKEAKVYINNTDVRNSNLEAGNLILIKKTSKRPKMVFSNGRWQKSESKEFWINDFAVIQ